VQNKYQPTERSTILNFTQLSRAVVNNRFDHIPIAKHFCKKNSDKAFFFVIRVGGTVGAPDSAAILNHFM
jgi:hypothetical protein